MVSQTRLEYGFNGYQVPVFPRACRSARVRVPIRKTSGNSQKRAFEILVSVAGELLQESKTSVPEDQQIARKNLVSKEQEDERQSTKCNISDQETCDEKTFISYHQIDTLNKFSCAPDWFNSKAADANLKSFDQLANVSGRNANPSAELRSSSLVSREFSEGKVEDAGTEPSIIRTVKSETPPLTVSLDVSQMDRKTPDFFCSDSKASMFKDWITLGPSRHSDTIDLVNRDDDKKYIGCTQAATTLKAFRLPSNVADQRIKNLSSSRHWGVSPNLNGGASFRNDGKRFQDGRTSYSRQRSKRMSSFKRRGVLNQRPFSRSDRGFQLDNRFNSADKRSDGDNSSAAIRVGSSIASPHPHLGSRERNVKLRIKSFKVPELLVEIPTTATVGSLKRTVMEAVTTALGDGLHVGILLQGKKVKEDGKTLLQTGISRDGKHRNLGFMLEPGHPQIIPPPCLGEQRITRHVTSFTLEPETSGVSGHVPPVSGCNNGGESDLHLVSSLPNISANTITLLNSQSVLSIPAISVGALAVVPTHLRARRRIRRPFSVSEVEALVQAVEKLGTGRWRDVKLHAFDNAKHRTYVDLKDKWKTLVHTARISPQQRRGEPLPQELLDRVLAVHAYWSQQQAKQLLESGV
ncbi:TRF-like 2 [Hibiscus trionum]|uniref:TRF-like 2 n=1 Tax=Hibiscus trionum TaxID=183268 RepID=A0A9W7LQ23_HIBTR|nr:TRF-like 2 [Hibiscus trionum]